jgi:hypothetical protein
MKEELTPKKKPANKTARGSARENARRERARMLGVGRSEVMNKNHSKRIKPKKPLDPLLADLPRELRGNHEWERRHIEFTKRRLAFEALSRKEQEEMASFVLDCDPKLADEVVNGITPLFEAFHKLKVAEAFLENIRAHGLPMNKGQRAMVPYARIDKG